MRRHGTVSRMIEAGEKAPQFTLPNQDGEEVALADFSGRTVACLWSDGTSLIGAP